MRTDAVSGGKLPSSPGPVKSAAVAVHTSLVALLCIFATRVLSIGTTAAAGHKHASIKPQSAPAQCTLTVGWVVPQFEIRESAFSFFPSPHRSSRWGEGNAERAVQIFKLRHYRRKPTFAIEIRACYRPPSPREERGRDSRVIRDFYCGSLEQLGDRHLNRARWYRLSQFATRRSGACRRSSPPPALQPSIERVHHHFAQSRAAVEGVFGHAAEAPVAADADHVVAGKQECLAERCLDEAVLPQDG